MASRNKKIHRDMVKLIAILLLLSTAAQAQSRKKRPQVIPEKDSVRTMQYAINSVVFNDDSTEKINLMNVRNGNWLSIPQDTFMLARYRGKNDGSIDTILHIRGGNVKMSPKNQLTIPYTQIADRPTLATVATSGSYNDLVNKPTIPTMFPDSVQYYNASGRVYSKIKKWVGRVAVTSANGQSVDISSCGCNTILSIVATAEKNGNASTASPNVAIKSYTTSAVTFNFTEANGAVVSILGINVLSGLPLIFANTTGLFVHVEVTCI